MDEVFAKAILLFLVSGLRSHLPISLASTKKNPIQLAAEQMIRLFSSTSLKARDSLAGYSDTRISSVLLIDTLDLPGAALNQRVPLKTPKCTAHPAGSRNCVEQTT